MCSGCYGHANERQTTSERSIRGMSITPRKLSLRGSCGYETMRYEHVERVQVMEQITWHPSEQQYANEIVEYAT